MKTIKSYSVIMALMICVLFLPTPALANTATWHYLSDRNKEDMVTIQAPLTLHLDGSLYQTTFILLATENGSPLISLSDCMRLFSCQAQLEEDETLQLQIAQKTLTFTRQDLMLLEPGTIVYSQGTALHLDSIYLPLQPVVEASNYNVEFTPTSSEINLFSPAYQDQADKPTGEPLLPDNLPRWGSLAEVPQMTELWPGEEIIGGYYTSLINSPAGRTHNIVLSCEKICGTVVESQEVFSFNRTVGERTAAAGYQFAPVFSGRKVVPGIGGGICQTSSTLYNAALETEMVIAERHRHSMKVTYVPAGRDATVSWGSIDFKFRNSQDYPVRVLARVYQNYVVLAFARVSSTQ